MSSTKKNLIFQICYQILIIITPLITSPYVSRVIGAEGLGIYSYTYSLANYLMILAMLGTINYGTRSIALVKNDKKKISIVFNEIFTLQIIVSFFSIILYLIYLKIANLDNPIISYIQIILIISCFFNINWLFFGLEEFKLTVTRNIFIKISTVIAIFIFVKTDLDLWKYVLILGLGELISQVMLIYFAKRFIKFKIPNFKNVIKHIKPNLIMFIPGIAFSVNNILDKTMLGWFSDYNNSGLYYNAEKLINIPMGIITGVGTVMMPRISNMISNGNNKKSKEYLYKTILGINIVSIAMTFGICSIAKEFVPIFFGDEFIDSVQLIMVLSIVILIRAISNVIRTQYLMPRKLDKVYSKAMMLSAATNVVLNLVLIRKYGAMGAVFSTIVSEIIVNIYQNKVVEKYIKVKQIIFKSYLFLISGISMFIIVRIIANKLSDYNVFVKLIIEIICGGAVYTLMSLIILIIFYKDNSELIQLNFRNKKGDKYEI